MKKATKAWLIAAVALVLMGGVLFAGVMTAIGWDFSRLSTVRYEANTHEIVEPFQRISLTTDTADIAFVLSNDGTCRVDCYEEENAKHSVAVEGDTLVIQLVDARSWYDSIGFHFGSPKITVSLPKAEYDALSIHESTGKVEIPREFAFADTEISLSTGDVDFDATVSESVKIQTSTGNVRVGHTSVGSLDVSVVTGKTTLTDIACKNIVSAGSTGSISLNGVIATEKISIERSTGDVKFSECDAGELYVKTDTGDVTGSLLTDKVFITQTDTGKIDVPKAGTGGRCEISTDTGDIQITID